ncbi:MAG: hypothetical protein ACRD1K_04770 [Acidimicrobiales bacterium]
MHTDVAQKTELVLDYLAERGGVAEVPPGRSLLRQMADDLGWRRAELTAAIAELETEGVVQREARDRRTFRLTLADPASPAAGAVDLAKEPVEPQAQAPAWEPAPPPPPEPASWAPIVHSEPEPARKSRFSRREKPDKASKEPKAMSGVVYEVREMQNTSFEGIAGNLLSRHKGPKEAFAEVRRLNLQRSGGRFTPRVVVRVDPDGTEDIAIPFDERARPVHFPYTLSGGRR